MNNEAKRIQRTYLTLMLGNTLAASFIWGINTLFLLDAGLSNVEAFAANAFFTAGMMIFEVPTGVVADTWGRRTSFMLGTVTLSATTLAYWVLWQMEAGFWWWAVVSIAIGFGFTFFSGAVEAWLVDALNYAGFDGQLEKVFGRGQMVAGAAMLGGSVAGGVIAQATNLGVPFLMRVAVLAMMFVVAARLMHDLGFERDTETRPMAATKQVLDASITHGLKNRPVRWVMLAAPFSAGVGFYAFYAMQPYILELYGKEDAYAIAGIAAAIVAGAQIVGGLVAPWLRNLVKLRTSALISGTMTSVVVLVLIGTFQQFWVVLGLMTIWALVFAALMPVRQAYLNDMIPSKQRATVLSFDSLMGSSGGVVVQPALGRVADVNGYGASFVVGAGIQVLAIPFLLMSRRERSPADAGLPATEGD